MRDRTWSELDHRFGWDKAETSTEEALEEEGRRMARIGAAQAVELQAAGYHDEPDPAPRETPEQIEIRVLRDTLRTLLSDLRADLEPEWTAMAPSELKILKSSIQLSAISANSVLARLEEPA